MYICEHMEQHIPHLAIENLWKCAGMGALWVETGPLDGELHLKIPNRTHVFVAEVKKDVRAHQIPQLEAHAELFKDFLLVAHHLYPKVKEELRQKGINYLEANGNAFLKEGDLFVYVEARKPLDLKHAKGNRAFTKTGLKVLFHLLRHKDDINLTQRELAEKTEVALGNIPQVIDGLKETGFLIPLNQKAYVWENRAALLERWIVDYATVLRPKLNIERFAYRDDWRDIPLDATRTVWGGEPAADILTGHLRPETFLLYTRETRKELIGHYRLRPDAHGDILAMDLFWTHDGGRTAPPLLVYADLMLEGGKRNRETAALIFDEHIKPNL